MINNMYIVTFQYYDGLHVKHSFNNLREAWKYAYKNARFMYHANENNYAMTGVFVVKDNNKLALFCRSNKSLLLYDYKTDIKHYIK